MSTIRDVRICQPVAQNSPDDWRTSMGQILVAIDTEDGLTGYGVGGGGLAGLHVVESVFKNYLIGQAVECVEAHWNQLSRAVLPFGPEGIAMMALSGVDLALWDLRGKLSGLSVAALLNPNIDHSRPISVYQTVWDTIPDDVTQSNTSVKLHLGASQTQNTPKADLVKQFIEKVHRARNALGGTRKLMVDAWMTWDLETTLNFATQAKEYNLAWIEEPLPLTDRKGYEILARESPVSIAGGEHIFTAHNFQDIIDRRLHTILQPDVCWVGGMTELVKIYTMSRLAGIPVIPHRGAELWSLHAVAALNEQPLAESGRPWMSWVGGQPQISQGTLQLPDRPGFGVEIDEQLFTAESTIRL